MPFDFFSSTYVDLRYITMIFLKIITWNATRTLPTTSWVAQKHTHPNKSWDIRSPFPQIWWFPPTRVSTGKFQPPTVRSEHFDIHRYGGISIATHPKLGFAHTFQHLMAMMPAACRHGIVRRKPQGSWGKKKTNGVNLQFLYVLLERWILFFILVFAENMVYIGWRNKTSNPWRNLRFQELFGEYWRCWSYTPPLTSTVLKIRHDDARFFFLFRKNIRSVTRDCNLPGGEKDPCTAASTGTAIFPKCQIVKLPKTEWMKGDESLLWQRHERIK